jgi:hypothetical protein
MFLPPMSYRDFELPAVIPLEIPSWTVTPVLFFPSPRLMPTHRTPQEPFG